MKKMKEIWKRALTLFMVFAMVILILPLELLTVEASNDESVSENRLAFSDMQIGKKYIARFDYSKYQDMYLYYLDGNGNVVKYDVTSVMKEDFPQELTVTLLEGVDNYVYVTNDDWPEEYKDYRVIEFAELIVIACIDPVPDENFIKGQVDLTDGANAIGELSVAKGEKTLKMTSTLPSGIGIL